MGWDGMGWDGMGWDGMGTVYWVQCIIIYYNTLYNGAHCVIMKQCHPSLVSDRELFQVPEL